MTTDRAFLQAIEEEWQAMIDHQIKEFESYLYNSAELTELSDPDLVMDEGL